MCRHLTHPLYSISHLVPSTKAVTKLALLPTTLIPVFLSRNIFLRSVDWHRWRETTWKWPFRKWSHSTSIIIQQEILQLIIFQLGFFFVFSSFECRERLSDDGREKNCAASIDNRLHCDGRVHNSPPRPNRRFYGNWLIWASSKGSQATGLWCWQSGMEESFTGNLVQTCIMYC